MGVAKALGLDSMVPELVRFGVPEEVRVHWVTTRGKQLKSAVKQRVMSGLSNLEVVRGDGDVIE